MNLIILKSNLKEALSIISGARKDSANLPILKNFLIEADESRMKISSTDLEIGITYNVSAKILEAGSAAVIYNTFSQIVNNLSFERVNLEIKGNNLLITTDSYKAKISTAPRDEYPIIPQISSKGNNYFSFESQYLIDSFLGIVSACQISDLRPELNGILFSYKDGAVKMAATDSFRLSEKTVLERRILRVNLIKRLVLSFL